MLLLLVIPASHVIAQQTQESTVLVTTEISDVISNETTSAENRDSRRMIRDAKRVSRDAKRIKYRHDFRIGVGYYTAGATGFVGSGGRDGYRLSFSPTAYVYYGYRAVAGLKVSLTLGYNQVWNEWYESEYDGGQQISREYVNKDSRNVRISPSIQYEWFNRGIVTMYTDIGISWILPSNRMGLTTDYARFGYITPNITPFGITVGKKWFGHAELFSLGARGLFNAGVGYRF